MSDESRPYEVERDRFGTMYSGPLEVGEYVEVVPVAALLSDEASAAAEELLVAEGVTYVASRRLGERAVKEALRVAMVGARHRSTEG